MVENVYNNTSAEKETYQTEGRKAPKNVRQVGYFTGNFRIYIEDYVCTFTRWLAEQDYAGRCVAVLVGEFAKSEYTRDVYAYGCIVMEAVDAENCLEITGDHWSYIYENIKEYFPDGEIVGWFYGGTSFTEQEKEMLKQVHLDHFAGVDRVLMLYDFLEKEEELYRYEEGELARQSGYYIYYEKNEEMQNYMIDKKQGRNRIEEVDDRVVRQVRARFATQKKEEAEELLSGTVERKEEKRGGERFLYVSGIAAAAVAVVIGAAVVYNGERLEGFEQTLNQMLYSSAEHTEGDKANERVQENTAENFFDEPLYQETFGNDTTDEGEAGKASDDNTSIFDQQEEPADMEQQPEISEKPEKGDEGQVADRADQPEADAADKNEQTVTPEENTPDIAEPQPEENTQEGTETGGEKLFDTSNYQFYIVQPGDTLAGICKKLYGNTEYMQHIKELNQITDENLIYAEQELLVP